MTWFKLELNVFSIKASQVFDQFNCFYSALLLSLVIIIINHLKCRGQSILPKTKHIFVRSCLLSPRLLLPFICSGCSESHRVRFLFSLTRFILVLHCSGLFCCSTFDLKPNKLYLRQKGKRTWDEIKTKNRKKKKRTYLGSFCKFC